VNWATSDLAIMQRVAEGDAQAFRELTELHLQAILTYCFRLTGNRAEAEELSQEVFLRAWQRASEYQPKARVTTWLHRIAHNLAIDALRRRPRAASAIDDLEVEPSESSSRNPLQLLERKHAASGVQAELEKLPQRQKMALLLCHEQGMSNPEIAEVLDTGVEAVESLLSRARRALRTALNPTHETTDDPS
jgi:RNA polymerase sigma-70 factor (ECF subfamily)